MGTLYIAGTTEIKLTICDCYEQLRGDIFERRQGMGKLLDIYILLRLNYEEIRAFTGQIVGSLFQMPLNNRKTGAGGFNV